MFLEGVYGRALPGAWKVPQCLQCLVRAELDVMSRCLSICKCLPVAIDFDSSLTHCFAGIPLRTKWDDENGLSYF